MEKKKREFWPVGIVLAMLTFMGGIVFAVTIMMRQPVPLTSDDYYAKEIAFQSQIDQANRGIAPTEKPVIRILRASEAVEISFPSGGSAADFQGKLTFYRPSDPSKDFSQDLKIDQDGKHWMQVKGKEKGLWMIKLEWSKAATAYYYEEQIML